MVSQQYIFVFDAGEDEAQEFIDELEPFRPVLSVLEVRESKEVRNYQVVSVNGLMADLLATMLRFHSISYSMEVQEVME